MCDNRKAHIAHSFGRQTDTYEKHAIVQQKIAHELSALLPRSERSDILEIGCGTGFLTEKIIKIYPHAVFDISDVSPAMLTYCQEQFSSHNNMNFLCADGEALNTDTSYDLIVSSMVAQWFSNPARGLENLTRFLTVDGCLYYASLGPNSFPEWKDSLKAVHAPSGILEIPHMPGIIKETYIEMHYENAQEFLHSLKKTGANQPKAGYSPLSPALLRKACRYCDTHFRGTITWHIVFGRLTKQSL